MYYIVCGEQIVESQWTEPTKEGLQEWADSLQKDAYVIYGEHYGMGAEPTASEDLAAEVKRLKAQVEKLRTLLAAELSLFDSEIDDLLAEQE